MRGWPSLWWNGLNFEPRRVETEVGRCSVRIKVVSSRNNWQGGMFGTVREMYRNALVSMPKCFLSENEAIHFDLQGG